jgi:hypothetical protein
MVLHGRVYRKSLLTKILPKNSLSLTQLTLAEGAYEEMSPVLSTPPSRRDAEREIQWLSSNQHVLAAPLLHRWSGSY